MLISLALMLLMGLVLSELFQKIHIPGLIAMILTGVALGPSVLNWLDPTLLAIAPDLREIALIVILLRVGLQLDLQDLKMVGRPALLLSFVPALMETLAITLAGSLLDCDALARSGDSRNGHRARSSPAVVVPRMLHLMETGAGWEKPDSPSRHRRRLARRYLRHCVVYRAHRHVVDGNVRFDRAAIHSGRDSSRTPCWRRRRLDLSLPLSPLSRARYLQSSCHFGRRLLLGMARRSNRTVAALFGLNRRHRPRRDHLKNLRRARQAVGW
ncbi:MAG: cation:proton antiporter [Bacillus subtilis]|nr:cation:proton antiporter [Bacillus subtilis]